jgi:hypothetical protein
MTIKFLASLPFRSIVLLLKRSAVALMTSAIILSAVLTANAQAKPAALAQLAQAAMAQTSDLFFQDGFEARTQLSVNWVHPDVDTTVTTDERFSISLSFNYPGATPQTPFSVALDGVPLTNCSYRRKFLT